MPRFTRSLLSKHQRGAKVQPHGVRIARLAELKNNPRPKELIMKRLLYLAAAAIAICVLSTTTYAQSGNLKLRFQAPFPFTVENTTFAAGDYEVTDPSRLILELRNLKDQTASFQHVQPARSYKEADGRMRLIFHRYGSDYFLAVISDGSPAATFDLRPSEQEKQLANASPKPQLRIVTVLADGTIREVGGR